ncbi:MAG: hypothetical protein IJD92_05635 [Bacilli bacterium]|nr:hypothetical protein [Bacilli bacterium]
MEIFNRRIEFKTFFKKGLPKIDDRYGVYFITGRQGSGKSYYGVKLLLAQDKKTCACIHTNIKSLNIPGYNIKYFDSINELYYNTDEYCIFLIDEISRKYDKTSRTDTQFYAWLNQSRKRKRIVIMITQEWRELPMWIRRPAKIMITTKKNILSGFGIYTTIVGDAENLIFNKEEGEYECPTIKKVIYKRNKKIADMYDTFEAVNTL